MGWGWPPEYLDKPSPPRPRPTKDLGNPVTITYERPSGNDFTLTFKNNLTKQVRLVGATEILEAKGLTGGHSWDRDFSITLAPGGSARLEGSTRQCRHRSVSVIITSLQTSAPLRVTASEVSWVGPKRLSCGQYGMSPDKRRYLLAWSGFIWEGNGIKWARQNLTSREAGPLRVTFSDLGVRGLFGVQFTFEFLNKTDKAIRFEGLIAAHELMGCLKKGRKKDLYIRRFSGQLGPNARDLRLSDAPTFQLDDMKVYITKIEE